MRSIRLIPLVLLFACGDNDGKDPRPDAPPRVDAAVDAPAPLTCAYTEMSDGTNDEFFGPSTDMPEATGQTFSQSFQLCGTLNNNWANNTQRVDSDAYQFTVPAGATGIRVYVTAPGAEALDTVLVDFYHSTLQNQGGTGEMIGNFAVAARDGLMPGEFVVIVTAYHSAAPTATIDYKINVMVDMPNRCAKSTATANFTEASDGVTADGNDVLEVRYQGSPRRQLTANPLDAAEQTSVTVAAGSTYRITGTSSNPTVAPASWADSFQDRDTYQITTGANTNELSVRLNWPGTTADFDVFLFRTDSPIEFANGWDGGNMEDELFTTAVPPNTSYYIWVGLDDQSTGQPITYDLTVCGEASNAAALKPSPAASPKSRWARGHYDLHAVPPKIRQ